MTHDRRRFTLTVVFEADNVTEAFDVMRDLPGSIRPGQWDEHVESLDLREQSDSPYAFSMTYWKDSL